jgi:hydrogenase maturation protease
MQIKTRNRVMRNMIGESRWQSGNNKGFFDRNAACPTMATKTVVLGIGNTLLGDEGAGVHALRALRARATDLADVEYLDGGTLSFTLAAPIGEAEHLIVIDAAQLNAAPGTIRMFEDDEMDRFLGSRRKASVHEVGLIDLMAMARLAGSFPQRRALIGIQPEYLDWAEAPTSAVAAAIPQACDLALETLQRWRA